MPPLCVLPLCRQTLPTGVTAYNYMSSSFSTLHLLRVILGLQPEVASHCVSATGPWWLNGPCFKTRGGEWQSLPMDSLSPSLSLDLCAAGSEVEIITQEIRNQAQEPMSRTKTRCRDRQVPLRWGEVSRMRPDRASRERQVELSLGDSKTSSRAFRTLLSRLLLRSARIGLLSILDTPTLSLS